jgi:DNA-binding SARP family transcriptional activator
MVVEFRLLGPVEVWIGDRRVDVGQPRQRGVLAALTADAGRTVSTEVLIDRVWGDTPPPGARRSLHAHITRIRRVLEQAGDEPVPLRHGAGGYRLDCDPQQVDIHRLRGLLDLSRKPGCSARQRVELLRQAVPLWRGEPLAGISGQWAERMRQSSRQLRSNVMLAWAEAELEAGNPEAVISRLGELAAENALSESQTAVLMRALHTAGRPAEALDQYTTIRRRLAEELGADPSAELQALHQRILRGDPRPSPPPPTADPGIPPIPPIPPTPDRGKPRPRRFLAAAMALVLLAGFGAGSLCTAYWMKRSAGNNRDVTGADPDRCTGSERPPGKDVLPARDWWANEPTRVALNSGARRFDVSVPPGTKRPGDVLVIMSDVLLTEGHDYVLAFTAATERQATILLRMQDSEPPDFFPSYSHFFPAGPAPCRHQYRFTAAKTSPRSEFTFQLGGQPERLDLAVSDVVLVEQTGR